jgi:site-specific DNA-cytosine methylase
MIKRTYNVFGMCSGLGGGIKGIIKSISKVRNMEARWRCIGGIDIDPAAARDHVRLVGTPITVMDLMTREQYIAFNGHEPPHGWREATPADIKKAANNEHPHAMVISSPCKGASGLLSETKSLTPKYQALNELTLRCIWLMCETWKDDPVELLVFENVPRLATRGRHLLDQIIQVLQYHGYAVHETKHDCGELGGLPQSRKRMLLVARHMAKVPAFLYEPEKKTLQGVGTVLGRMPLPGDPAGGPMHRIPSLSWKTWVRLAFVRAGSDWRSLNELAIENGHLRDYLIVPENRHRGFLGVHRFEDTTGTITGRSAPTTGAFAVADMRAPAGAGQYQQYGVLNMAEHVGAVTAGTNPGQGAFSVADPRTGIKHNNCFRVVEFDHHAGVITGGTGPSAGGQAVADPRPSWEGRFGPLAVMDWERHANTVIAGGKGVQGGWMSVADPRPNMNRGKGDHYLTGGHYGVVPFDASAGAVSASACHDNGRWSVADPRMPRMDEKLIAIIRSMDGTWHRPFTTLELAAIQSLIEPEEYLELDGLSDQAWRERIGNAIPPAAFEAVGEVMGTTLLLAESGETFALSATPIWVRPVAIALSLAQGDQS